MHGHVDRIGEAIRHGRGRHPISRRVRCRR
jgi:hypothetical protein